MIVVVVSLLWQESKSNEFESLIHRAGDDKIGQDLIKPQPVLSETDKSSTLVTNGNGYESFHGEGENDSRPMSNQLQNAGNQSTKADYCFAINEDDEYDYDAPFFVPANEERELVSQIRNLRMLSIPEENLR